MGLTLNASSLIALGASSAFTRNASSLRGSVARYSSDQLSGNDGDAYASWADLLSTGPAVQATGALKPTLRIGVNGIDGQPCLEFDGGDFLVTPSMFGPGFDKACALFLVFQRKTGSAAATVVGSASNGITLNRQEFSLSPVVDPRGVVGAPYTDLPAVGFTTAVADGISASQYRQAPTPDGGLGQTVVAAFGYNGTRMYMESNALPNSLPDLSFIASTINLGLTGALTIGTKADGSNGGNWKIAHVGVAMADLSIAEIQAETLLLRQKYHVDLTRVLWCVGDSTMRGFTTSNQPFTGPPGFVLANLTTPAVVISQGVSGSKTTDWIGPDHTWLSGRVTQYHAADRRDTVIFDLGINDTLAYTSPNPALDAAAMTNLQAIGDEIRTANMAAGMCTIPQRPQLTTLIRAGWTGHADFLVDLMQDPAFDNLPDPGTDYANTANYSDGLHWTDLGSSIAGRLIAGAINARSGSGRRRGLHLGLGLGL